MMVKKYYLLPSVASRAREGSLANPSLKVEEPNGTGSSPTNILFLPFEPLPWDQMCRVLTLCFCFDSSAMVELFSFDDVLNTVHIVNP